MKKILFLLLFSLFFYQANSQRRSAIHYHIVGRTYSADRFVVSGGVIYKALVQTSNTPPHADWGSIDGGAGAELDPVFSAAPAFGISTQNISNWDEAFSWNDPAGVYLPLSGGLVTGPSTFSSIDMDLNSISNVSNLYIKSVVHNSLFTMSWLNDVMIFGPSYLTGSGTAEITMSNSSYFTTTLSTSNIEGFSDGVLVPKRWVTDKMVSKTDEIIAVDTIQTSNDLIVRSGNTYGGFRVESQTTTFDQFFVRMGLKGFGEATIDNSFSDASTPYSSKISLRPGTGNWQLITTEGKGARQLNHSDEITDVNYDIQYNVLAPHLDDTGKLLYANNISPQTFTLPPASFLVEGWNVAVMQKGAAQVTIAAQIGDTLRVPDGRSAKTRAQNSPCAITYQGGEFYIMGDLE